MVYAGLGRQTHMDTVEMLKRDLCTGCRQTLMTSSCSFFWQILVQGRLLAGPKYPSSFSVTEAGFAKMMTWEFCKRSHGPERTPISPSILGVPSFLALSQQLL